jgi:hypothetical protein
MAYTVQRLTAEHIVSVVGVINARAVFSGVTDPELLRKLREQHVRRTSNVFDPSVVASGMAHVYGVFEDDRLVSVAFTATSEHQVCYYIVRWHTLPGVQSAEVLKLMWAKIIEDYEALGYYRFMIVFLKKHMRAYPRMATSLETAPGYIAYTELELPPDTPPKQAELWEKLYGRILYPEETVVRSFVKPAKDVRGL